MACAFLFLGFDDRASMKVLSLLLRNAGFVVLPQERVERLNESPELIAQEFVASMSFGHLSCGLNESPELIAQE